MEPITDREIMMQIDGKLDRFADSMERFAVAIDNLEKVKFEQHEKRISKLEKFKYQIIGALILITSVDVIINIYKVLIEIK